MIGSKKGQKKEIKLQGKIPLGSTWFMLPPPATGEMECHDWPGLEDMPPLSWDGDREPHK